MAEDARLKRGHSPRSREDGADLPHEQLSQRGGCAIVWGEHIGEKEIAWLRHHIGIQLSRIWISHKQI